MSLETSDIYFYYQVERLLVYSIHGAQGVWRAELHWLTIRQILLLPIICPPLSTRLNSFKSSLYDYDQ